MKIIYTNKYNDSYTVDLAYYQDILLFLDNVKKTESTNLIETLESLGGQIYEDSENALFFKNLGLAAKNLGLMDTSLSDLSTTYYETAIKYLEIATQLKPSDSRTFFELALTKKANQNFSDAYANVLAAIELLGDLDNKYLLADCHQLAYEIAEECGQTHEALDHQQKHTELTAEFSNTAYLQGEEANSNGEYKVALLNYNLAISYDKTNLLAYIGKGQALYMLSAGSMAIECFEFVYNHELADSAVLTKTGKVCNDLGKNLLAQAFFKKAYDLDHDNTEAQMLLEPNQTNDLEFTDQPYNQNKSSDLENKMAGWAVAAEADEPKLSIEFSNVAYQQGQIYSSEGNYDLALLSYQLAIDHDNTNLLAYIGIGRAYHMLDEKDLAIKYFEFVYLDELADSIILTEAGQICNDLENKQLAQKFLQKAYILEQDKAEIKELLEKISFELNILNQGIAEVPANTNLNNNEEKDLLMAGETTEPNNYDIP